MADLALLAGVVAWLLLAGHATGSGGAAPETLDLLVGAWLVFLPSMAWGAASRYAASEERRSTALVLSGRETSGLLAAGGALLPWALLLGGLLSAVPLGRYPYTARAVAGLWGAAPLFLLSWILAVVLGQLGSFLRWQARDHRLGRLWVTTLGLLACTDPARGLSCRHLGAWFRARGSGHWVSLGVEGQVLEVSILVVGGLAILLEVMVLSSPPRPLPVGFEEEVDGVPLGRIGPLELTRWYLVESWRRWGWSGVLAGTLLVLAAGRNLTAWILLPAILLHSSVPLLGSQILLVLGLLLVAPEWVPPPPDPRGLLVPEHGVAEAEQAWSLGCLRAAGLTGGLALALALSGGLEPVDLSLLLVEGAIVGATVMGLSCWGMRAPGGVLLGGGGYLLGVATLVAPHLVMAGNLALLRELPRPEAGWLYLAWFLVKVLLLAASLALGAHVSLVYCREWSTTSPWTRAASTTST